MKKITLSLLLLVGVFVASFAQKHEWKEGKSNGYTYKYVTNDPSNARFYTLPNGLTVILSPSKKEPRIQAYFAVKAGSKTDPSTHTGLAHYLEHMLFKGTDRYGTLDWSKEKPLLDIIDNLYEQYNHTTDEAKRKVIYAQIDSVSGEAAKYAIANEYDKISSAMGAKGTNAWTSFEETVYTEDVPSNAIDKYLTLQAERFRNPVLRLFHTELEAVYEEKNRSLDSDSRTVFETMFANLFKNHNYGLQTTIGTVEHLRNPSLIEIRKYFETYYVPNNIGIVMAGDFNPDEVIAKIDKSFGYMQPRPISPYTFKSESPITAPVETTVTGPEAESVLLGFRFPGAASKDAKILELVGSILTNGAAGLIDINLVRKQQLLSAYAFPYTLKDYSMLLLQGNPTEGQSLEDVRKLLVGELNNLKKGNFSKELLTAIINNQKKSAIERNESYSSRANYLLSHFTSELDWMEGVNYINTLNSITKQDIVDFANKYLNENYVVVYKRKGERQGIEKVEKPTITPVSINTKDQSDFLKRVNSMPENEIAPIWINYKKDIQTAQSGSYPVLAVENKDNNLFRLNYYFETGSWSNKLLPLAAQYLDYIGTYDKSMEEISKAFYQLASSFSVNVGNETTYISIDGLYENIDESVKLLENLLRNAKADQAALESYKARLMQSRINAKQNKNAIMQGLLRYAQYGKDNPFNHNLSNQELSALKAEDLIAALRELLQYPHQILYYGPGTANQIAQKLQQLHPTPSDGIKALPQAKRFQQLKQNENKVFFAHYDMVQAEVFWTRTSALYNPNIVPVSALFNEYFGGGMGSVVFQTIRESKALAYSTYSRFSTASDKRDHNSITAYVGTQADKFHDAIQGMNELLDIIPQSEKGLANAKDGLKKNLATQRITDDGIIFSYLRAQRLGLDKDIRKDIFEQIDQIGFNELTKFHQNEFSKKPYSYCVLANEQSLSDEDLKKYGKVQKLNLEDIFGY